MKPFSAFDNFPTFAENGARTMDTTGAKYSIGFAPADTFPAEWANYLFHGASKGVSDLNAAVTSTWQELQNVVTASGQTPTASQDNQLLTAIQTMIQNAVLTANAQVLAQAKLDAHPVHSLYWSSDPTNPADLFGGTWVQIKDHFVWAKGDSDTVNATGGAKTVSLTTAQLPSHNHGGSTGNSSPSTNAVSLTTGGMNQNSYGWFETLGQWNGNALQYAGNINSLGSYSQVGLSGGAGNDLRIIEIHNSHVHSIGAHSHTVDSHSHSISAEGNGIAHENMPPYIAKYCWERTA